MTELSPKPAPSYRRRLMIVRAIVALCAILIALGVYEIGRLRGNPPPDATCKPAVNIANRVAPLAQGEVAAFAPAQKPFHVPNVAFKDAQGHDRTLADWRGRTVLLNLWATWCVPCRREMPTLDALQAKLGSKDFEVVAVNLDTRDPQKPLAFLKDENITHLAHYSDNSARVFEDLKAAGKAFGMPTTLIVDPAGCEIGNMAGPAEWASPGGVKLVSSAISGS